MNIGTMFDGHVVKMKTDHALHYSNDKKMQVAKDDVSTSFADLLKGVVGRVNDLQVDSERLSEKMIYEPESVDIHTVMISAQKAEVALGLAKAVRDEALQAYRNLTNLR